MALSDYDRFHELSTRYEESRFIAPAADGTPRVYSKLRGCVWFFCRTVERYARLTLTPDTRITATVEPDDSDMDYGLETWELESLGMRTRVLYRHEAKPKFWIPPVIGVWGIKRVLNKDAVRSAEAIEQLAADMDKQMTNQPMLEGERSEE